MCGRYSLSSPVEVVADLFGLTAAPPLEPRYNVAPTQEAPVVRVAAPGAPRTLALLRWGLVPYWAQDAKIGNRLINARAESAAQKPAFEHSFRKQRCLVVADGFYEWKKEGPVKQPYVIRRQDRLPFAFAGLWARWRPLQVQAHVGGAREPRRPGRAGFVPQPDGRANQPLETFTILTTGPNDLVRPLHDRMPVILERHAWSAWLDPALGDVERLASLLVPAPTEGWEAVPVSRAVNDPAHDAPDCIEPLVDQRAE